MLSLTQSDTILAAHLSKKGTETAAIRLAASSSTFTSCLTSTPAISALYHTGNISPVPYREY